MDYLEEIRLSKARLLTAQDAERASNLRLLAAKDEVDAAAYRARWYGDASYNSIARALGISDTRTAKNIINRGAEKVDPENGVGF